MKASLRFLRAIRCVSHVLSFLFSFSSLSSKRPGKGVRNCTNQLNLRRGNCQKAR